MAVDGTTSAGSTCTMTGTVVAGGKTANKGLYVACQLDTANALEGSQIIGVLTRETGTYASNVSLCEFGIHAPVNKTGFPLVM